MAWNTITKPSLPFLKWDNPASFWDEEDITWDSTSGYSDIDRATWGTFFSSSNYPFQKALPFKGEDWASINKPTL